MGRRGRDKPAQHEKEVAPESAHKPSRLYAPLLTAAVAVVAFVALVIAQTSGSNADAGQTTSASDPGTVTAGIVGSAESLDIASYPGQVVVVNYMAGWCRSCWGEIPGFIDVYRHYEPEGLVMIGISLQTSREQTESMIEQLAIPYPVYEDLEGNMAMNRFRLKTMPTTFVFKDGQLLYRLDGEVSAQGLRGYVEDAL
jgi:peroxiredoxin